MSSLLEALLLWSGVTLYKLLGQLSDIPNLN